MDDELKIRTNSPQELFQETIRTLPLQPQYVKIEMIANEIPFPKIGEEEAYISECSKNNIVPFSYVGMEYKSGLFVPTEIAIWSRLFWSKQKTKETIGGLIKGGKIHQIEIELPIQPPTQEGFETFREEFLDTMLKNRYMIDKGHLWLSKEDTKSGGYYRTSGLILGESYIEGDLKLELNDELKENKPFLNWFEQLKEKYEQSAQLKVKV